MDLFRSGVKTWTGFFRMEWIVKFGVWRVAGCEMGFRIRDLGFEKIVCFESWGLRL